VPPEHWVSPVQLVRLVLEHKEQLVLLVVLDKLVQLVELV
jgi:hypothetical protein